MKQLVRILVVLLLGLALVCGTFALGFGSGYALSRSTWASQSPVVAVTEIATHSPTQPTLPPCATPNCGDGPAWFGVYWEAWDLIENHFYGDLPGSSEVTYAAIRGVLSALGDDYTALIEPQVAAIVEEDATGEFEGIGAYVNVDANGQFVITQPFRSGPAEEAGLVSGDAVLAVDGVSTVGMSLYDVINLIRGPAGSTVTLLIQRPDEPEAFEVVVTRRRIEIPIVEAELRDDGIAYLRLNEFSATATRLVERSLSDLIEDEPVALVLDLRQNPGGWLDQAIGVADIFLDEGVAAREQTSDGVDHVFETETGDVGEYIPMVVLVDRGSASASEIVAGALQDRGRALLIGETTFGKGSVQRPFGLSDGSELRVTVAMWYTPDNRAIHQEGLQPDIEVPWPDEPDSTSDPQLERAVEYLLGGE